MLLAPASATTESILALRDQIDFVSHVAACYPDLTSSFPTELLDLLSNHHGSLPLELREKLVTSLVLLRRKELLESSTLLRAFFPILISTNSKSLRSLLYQKILTDIRMANAKVTAHKLNRAFQTDLHHLISQDRTSAKGIWAVRITKELWRRQVWTDSKAVETMKEAALADNIRVVAGGVNFFLGGDKEREEHADEGSSDEETTIDMGKLKHQAGINKKSRKNQRELRHAAFNVKKKEKKKSKPHPLNFSALHLLHDPQGFAETLFSRHLQSAHSRLNLQAKLQVLQLVSRLVGLHKLTILPLYSYYQKYLTPRQASVTTFLASLAQSTHNLVPPDVLEPLIIKIANEFVSEASAGPVAAAGVNAIREVCARQPLAMNDTLLQDLVLYRKSKDKSIMMAAKGLLSLYREVGPDMLKRRDRGREAAIAMQQGEKKQARFGEEDVGRIEGLELLQAYKDEERRKMLEEKGLGPEEAKEIGLEIEENDETAWKNWNVSDAEDSDDSGGWIDVSSEGEDINICDSDDDVEKAKPPTKKRKLSGTSSDPPAQGSTPVEKAPRTKEDDPAEGAQEKAATLQNLATSRILTPADLAKLNELRTSSSILSSLPKHARRRAQEAAKRAVATGVSTSAALLSETALTAADLEGQSRIGERATKEEKLASVRGDKDDKEKHKGKEAKRKERKNEAGKSSTNKEKARQKNFVMTLGKARGKQKRSLRDVSKSLKADKVRKKQGGRRGNR